MASSLSELPVEMIEDILSHLEVDDLYSFRLLCSKLNQKSIHYCSKRLFHTWGTSLLRPSLEKSEAIFQNLEISKGIQVLDITATEPWTHYGQGFTWDYDSSDEAAISLSCLFLLKRMLGSMPDCKSIVLTTYTCHRWPWDYTEADYVAPDSLAAIWDIIADHKFTSFKLNIATDTGYDKIDTQWLSRNGEPKPKIEAAWANLKDLSLGLSINADKRGQLKWLRPLLATAVNLQSLDMNISDKPEDTPAMNLLDSVGTYPSLQNLTLKCFYVTKDTLFRFLLRHAATVRSVDFSLTFVDSDSSCELLLALLRDNFPLLQSVTLRSSLARFSDSKIWFEGLYGDKMLPGAETMVFKTRAKKAGTWVGQVFWVSYTGSEMRKALDLIRASLVITKRA
jgi:hypothetical protein